MGRESIVSQRRHLLFLIGAGLFLSLGSGLSTAAGIDADKVRSILSAPKIDVGAIRAMGTGVLPVLSTIYRQSDEDRRAQIAWVFYRLGWKSQEAKEVLLQDVLTKHAGLRLQVQWALGRVSDDPKVVETLLDNLQNDPNPLFRDKAACALAYDQVHISDTQKVRLYEGLIAALESPNRQVRQVTIKALQIHTGQTKGFRPDAPEEQRSAAVNNWKRWLDEYKSNL